MVGGSAVEALRERIAWMEEILREWPSKDDTMALWASNIGGGGDPSAKEFARSHDQYF